MLLVLTGTRITCDPHPSASLLPSPAGLVCTHISENIVLDANIEYVLRQVAASGDPTPKSKNAFCRGAACCTLPFSRTET